MPFWLRYAAQLGDRRPPNPAMDVQAWLWGVDDGVNPREPEAALVARMAARWGCSTRKAAPVVREALARREKRTAPSLWGDA
jgi:hypothetical protein